MWVTQPYDQSRETTNGGRVYYTSTDAGNFRVGSQFKIEATGTATLNADAFDLSGLTELQLGSIVAKSVQQLMNLVQTVRERVILILVPTGTVKTYVDSNSFSTGKVLQWQ